MKALIQLSLFSALIFLVSCEPPTLHERFVALDKAERSALMDSLMESLHEEMYARKKYYTGRSVASHCGDWRNKLQITMDKKGRLMIRGQFYDSLPSISEKIVEHYSYNKDSNDLSSDYPLYTWATKDEVLTTYNAAIATAKEVEATEGATQDMIDFKWAQVESWKKKVAIFSTLQVELLPEISYLASVSIDYQLPKQAWLVDSTLHGFYSLRNDAAERYFDMSYLELYYHYGVVQDSMGYQRLEALELLYPLTIYDLPYCREHNAPCSFLTPEVEIPEPTADILH